MGLDGRLGEAQRSRVATLFCQSCGTRVPYDEPIPRDSECEGCRTDLRCCRNCRHYDPRMNNQCRETQADPVVEKTRRNFCEYFYFSREAFAGGGTGGREAEARAKLEAMFGGPRSAPDADRAPESPGGAKPSGAGGREEAAREKLRRLFGEGNRDAR